VQALCRKYVSQTGDCWLIQPDSFDSNGKQKQKPCFSGCEKANHPVLPLVLHASKQTDYHQYELIL